MNFSLKHKRIWVAGHAGMVGSAVVRRLQEEDCAILSVPRSALDLTDQAAVRDWVRAQAPDAIVLAAAKVGGIAANAAYPAEFIYQNLMIEANVIQAAYLSGVARLVFLGSSCIYPKEAENPISEAALLSGPLEPTNAAYAVAKIAGVQMVQAYRAQYGCDFISLMPCNLYGPGDCYDALRSHVIPALMMKAHAAKLAGAAELEVWGSGQPRREFLHVEDLADAIVFCLQHYSEGRILNIGAGQDLSIQELAEMICKVVGFKGALRFDASRPDGAMCKLMDSARIYAMGWRPRIELQAGLERVYAQVFEGENATKCFGMAGRS